MFTDNLFISKMNKTLSSDESQKAREAIMIHVRKVVPYALLVTVATGIYMFSFAFGEIAPEGLSTFQTLLGIKAFLGLWLGIRGFNQVFLKIDPLVFKSHKFPFMLVIIIIILSQFMHI